MVGTGALAERVRAGDRAALGRAITLVESTRDDHRAQAAALLGELGEGAASTRRVGITGVPGVGKSTFVDALGTLLLEAGRRVGVLAVDPSSARTGGSILGDKTRMPRLATDERAFVRPSPTGGTLGGVARATRETMALLEAAGHDVVLVETVGIGQAEIEVANMVDTFLVLALARSGDELQGIKKGVLELADVIAVNKADQGHEEEAGAAAAELRQAIHLLQGGEGSWTTPVLTCSALEERGLEEVWAAVERHRAALQASGELDRRRRRQRVRWMWAGA
ncbi:MAG: methylmalonyl Co-A mutase-associated GTPase MeaB, partial [Candidatus Dormibacteraeota bacterium]|nr:methylmalonyl Co-A mutase-associated GTPase MeaB [Candidatus Dormibacteraeota bacterium]